MSALTQLNFPRFVFRMRLMENPPKIWDAVRRRWLVLTPEEWVRQHLIRLLVERGGVPPGNVSQEYPVALSGAAQRADVVVTGRDGRPCLLAECKAPDVPLGREVFAQAVRYNSVVAAPYVLITNGLLHCCSSLDRSTRTLCGRGRPARFIPISGDLAIEAYIRPASPTWFSSIPFSVRRP